MYNSYSAAGFRENISTAFQAFRRDNMSKTAVITGTTSGLGTVFARRMAAQGYDLIITGRRQELLQKLSGELKREYKNKITPIIAELCNDQDLQKLIQAIQNTENIEMLINNAGFGGGAKSYLETEPAINEQMVKLHQIIPMRLIKAVLPGMVKQSKGTIINVASMAAYMPLAKAATYGATKAFLALFSESLAMELKPKGIQVQALCPGFIDTDFFRNWTQEDKKNIFSRFNAAPPEFIVDYSLKCLKNKDQVICMTPGRVKTLHGLCCLLPRTVLYKMMQSQSARR
jgi:uncharacterized protein